MSISWGLEEWRESLEGVAGALEEEKEEEEEGGSGGSGSSSTFEEVDREGEFIVGGGRGGGLLESRSGRSTLNVYSLRLFMVRGVTSPTPQPPIRTIPLGIISPLRM